jgi:outer membrane protein assembly factor BamB
MTDTMSLERMIVTVMADEADGTVPDRMLDDVLSVTGRMRPAPRWLALLKEPQMRVASRPVVGMPARRSIILLTTLLITVALVGVVVGASLLLRQPATDSDAWPMFRGDASRAGVALEGPTGNPVLHWRFQAGGAINSNVSIVGDLVYAASDDGILHALGVDDGLERWTFDAGSPSSGPSVANGLVYTTDPSGSFVALDAMTGQERWRSTATYSAATNAAVEGDLLAFGTGDGRIVILDAVTGTERRQTKVSSTGAVHSPALVDGFVYASSDAGGFVAIDAGSGSIDWTVDTGTDQTGTAIISDGLALLGATIASGADGNLRAVAAKTGDPRWQLDGLQYFSPTVDDGVVYTGSVAGTIHAYSLSDGSARWQYQVQGTARAPAVAAGVVYVAADAEHRVYALEGSSGHLLWTFDLDSGVECCIAVAQGAVYVGTNLGSVYSIGADGAAISPQPAQSLAAPTAGPTDTATPPPSESPSAVTSPVTFVWKSMGPAGGMNPTGLSVDPNGLLWATDGFSDRFAIFDSDGAFIETWGSAGNGDGKFKLTRGNGDPYGSVAFEPDGSFFVLDVGNRRVQHFDAKRHFRGAWGSFGSGPSQFSDPIGIAVGPDGNVNVLDDSRRVIETYDQDGNVLRTIDAFPAGAVPADGANSLAIDSDGNLYVTIVQPNRVIELDPSGALIRTFGGSDPGPGQFADQPARMAFDAAGRLYVSQISGRGDQPGIQVFDPNGTYLTGFGPLGSADGEISFPWGVAIDDEGDIYVTDLFGGPDDVLGVGTIQKFAPLPPLAP